MTKEFNIELSYKEAWDSLWMALKMMADANGKPIEPRKLQETMALMEKTFMGSNASD